ncbi:hypothetical protein BVRB_6g145050 [Beta vulgaris subsp. vulgaris]|uniref:Uncharacterized protein n=1 Tax=Beta vulgaris subsp. vulgaris TaxID=3555 RepID=A0A0J8C2F1_BETVV|nr:hypothetical protein BVRB_6g145050 [Beta vulgaris subsp. vulgaris]
MTSVSRIVTKLLKKTSKDYERAIEAFHKALTEHRNPDTLKKLNDAERANKELEQREYFSPKVADEDVKKVMSILRSKSILKQ